jgi:hypothetical protein
MTPSTIVTQMFSQIIYAYWWTIPLLFLIVFLKSPFMKGVFGELQVNLLAKFFLDKHIYTLFKNVTLPTEDGTTQIDHIIVSRYGIFVIETKNYKGWIFGGPQQQKIWTQKIYRHTSKFQNPLHQNYKHTQTLRAALELDPDKMFPVVVFVGNCTFKTAMPDNVVYAGGYIRFIKSKTQSILNDGEVRDICTRLQSGRIKPSIRPHIDHVKHVKTIVEKKQRQDKEDNSCPKCCKPMILRTARNGNNQGKQFFGCSDYPKCRMVRQIAV